MKYASQIWIEERKERLSIRAGKNRVSPCHEMAPAMPTADAGPFEEPAPSGTTGDSSPGSDLAAWRPLAKPLINRNFTAQHLFGRDNRAEAVRRDRSHILDEMRRG